MGVIPVRVKPKMLDFTAAFRDEPVQASGGGAIEKLLGNPMVQQVLMNALANGMQPRNNKPVARTLEEWTYLNEGKKFALETQ